MTTAPVYTPHCGVNMIHSKHVFDIVVGMLKYDVICPGWPNTPEQQATATITTPPPQPPRSTAPARAFSTENRHQRRGDLE